ncbi:MAG TPA: universal stress protein [Planctomycetota bacterium]|nr:universal stress protein [Planctomycetota bacterium]
MTCRILVALDGSEASEPPLYEAERIALGGAGVHFLHIVPMLPSTMDATSAAVMSCHDQALSYLGDLRARFPDVRGLDLIRTGDPADAVLQAASEFDIDLIVMGTQVRAVPQEGSLGRAARNVVREAMLPVILKRPGLPPPRNTLRRILVPLDGSPESLTILTTVKSLALQTGAEVVFLHVTERALVPASPDGVPRAPKASEHPKEKLLDIANRLEKSDLVFWQTLAPGEAVEEVLNHAKALDADLIAMAARVGRGRERTIVDRAALAIMERAEQAVLLQEPVIAAAAPRAWKIR